MTNTRIVNGKNFRSKNALEKDFLTNCQRCVAAFEARMRGFDVEAKPLKRKLEKDRIAKNWWKVFEGAKPERCTFDGRRDCDSKLAEWGSGACTEIYVQWVNEDGSPSNYAHVFVGVNYRGNIRYLDPQSGETDVSDYFEDAVLDSVQIVRIDDKAFTNLAK
nr:toxin glutamine deamidase domain-containing protein [Olegusella massiliensis]